MPVEPMESMLRPFNLVIPFTVQKGELTGTVLGSGGTTAQGVDTFVQTQTLVLRDENWGPEWGSELPRACSKLGRAETQTEGICLPVQGPSRCPRLVPNL